MPSPLILPNTILPVAEPWQVGVTVAAVKATLSAFFTTTWWVFTQAAERTYTIQVSDAAVKLGTSKLLAVLLYSVSVGAGSPCFL